MDPVEIDINLNGNVSEKSGEMSRSLSSLSSASKEAEEELRRSIALQKQHLARLKAEIARLELQVRESPYAMAQVGKALDKLKLELIDETEGLKHLQGELQLTGRAKDTLRTKIYQVRNAMAEMRRAGTEETEEYRQKRAELAELNDAYQAVVREQQLMTKGSASMTGLVSGLQGLLGAITATAGAMGALVGEDEDFAKIQTKVQSLLAITIGLQQLQQTGSSTSAFRLHTVTRATQLYTGAISRLSVALGISNAAAKVLLGTLTAGLSVAIGWAITAIDRLVTRQREAEEAARAFSRSVAEGVSSQIAKYEQLRQEYVTLEGDESRRQTFVEEHKKAFDELGVSIRNAEEADNLFVANADAFRRSLVERAKAVATFDLAVEQYKAAITKMGEAEAKRTEKPGVLEGFFTSIGFATSRDYARWRNNEAEELERQARVIRAKGDKLIEEQLTYQEKAKQLLEDAGISPVSPKGSTSHNNADRELKEREAALRRLARISQEAEKQGATLAIAALEEGRRRKLEVLKREHKERREEIEAQMQELAEMERRYQIDVSGPRARLEGLSRATDADFDRRRGEIEAASAEAVRGIREEAVAPFRSDLEQRLREVDRYYSALLDKARTHAASEAELEQLTDEIDTAHTRARELRHRESELRVLDLEERIEMRRTEMRREGFLLQADYDERRITKQLEAAKKRLRKLREIEAAGGDAADDIREAEQEVEGLTEALEKIPVQRLREVGQAVKGIFSQLASLGGEVGQTFSTLAASVDTIVTSFDKEALAMPRITGAVSGLLSLWQMAERQAAANAESWRKWQEALDESDHRRRLMMIEEQGYRRANLFGVENPYARAIAGAKQYASAMQQLSESLGRLQRGQMQVGTRKVVSGANIGSGAAAGAGVGAAVGSFLPGIGTAIGAGIGALLGGVFGATQRKVVPVFKSLVEQFGSILKEGTRTFELNPEILASYSKLDEETKQLVDHWDEIRKKAMDAEQQMEETFATLAGDLGRNLSQTLAAAWRDGDLFRAVDDYEKYVGETIGKIIEQLVFAQYFQGYFDELKKRFKDSFEAGGDQDIVDDIIWFSREYKRGVESYGKAMDEARKALKGEGIDAFGGTDMRRTAEARGIARASQDDITKFNGQMTLVVERVSHLVALKEEENSLALDRTTLTRALYSEVQVIAKNSAFLQELARIKSDISRLTDEGIKLRK